MSEEPKPFLLVRLERLKTLVAEPTRKGQLPEARVIVEDLIKRYTLIFGIRKELALLYETQHPGKENDNEVTELH